MSDGLVRPTAAAARQDGRVTRDEGAGDGDLLPCEALGDGLHRREGVVERLPGLGGRGQGLPVLDAPSSCHLPRTRTPPRARAPTAAARSTSVVGQRPTSVSVLRIALSHRAFGTLGGDLHRRGHGFVAGLRCPILALSSQRPPRARTPPRTAGRVRHDGRPGRRPRRRPAVAAASMASSERGSGRPTGTAPPRRPSRARGAGAAARPAPDAPRGGRCGPSSRRAADPGRHDEDVEARERGDPASRPAAAESVARISANSPRLTRMTAVLIPCWTLKPFMRATICRRRR